LLSDLLRTIGTACIIAGAFLFFNDNTHEDSSIVNENNKLQSEINTLQETLERTKIELADLQLTSATEDSLVNNAATSDNKKNEELDSSTQQVVTTILSITPGMDSSTAALTLERLGIIEQASNLENYLAKNNLSGKIQIGDYELDSSMTNEKIAALITKAN